MPTNKTSVVQIRDIEKSFKKGRAQELQVLDRVNFDMHEGEIIALLGRSGSGKSTLLRIIAGLIQPSAGSVSFHEQPITEPVQGLTMVFQHFALLPWLTVLDNVELGLQAIGMSRVKRRQRALEAIDAVGLDGFESAYPKELSGGMSQRVGLARALVLDPEVLLMDEPFSALDVLTAENLRGDLIDIWQSDDTNIKSVLLVTHNIEEAAALADRILIFSNNPGHIRAEIAVDLPHPRDDQSPGFRQLVDDIYGLMTIPDNAKPATKDTDFETIDIGYRLPKAQISEMMGLLEELTSREDQVTVDLPVLADELHFEVDELFPIIEALEILQFARVSEGDIGLTPAGKLLANTDILGRKKQFSKHFLAHVPVARFICDTLQKASNHEESEQHFLQELEKTLSKQAAEEVLTVAIDWGRYAEIFAFDYNSGILSFENPE